jgi:hypothetical protein
MMGGKYQATCFEAEALVAERFIYSSLTTFARVRFLFAEL